MRRVCILLLALLLGAVALPAQPSSPSADNAAFEGVWLGEIVAPNTRTAFGLAFTRAREELLVSIYFPEMFLYSANFGPAKFRDGAFAMDALNLVLRRDGENLVGTFAIGKLPVRLQRATSFASEPTPAVYPAAPAPLWITDLKSPAWASPVAQDGIIYVGTVDGKFHAIQSTGGAPLWTWAGTVPLYGQALATTENIFFVDERTDLVALNRSTGALEWRLPLHDVALAGAEPPRNETFNHRATSPVIDEKGVLYVGSSDGGVYAVRAKTGKKLWRQDVKAKVYAPITLRGEELIVGTFEGSVVILNRRTHQEMRRVKLGGSIVSSPVVAGNRIVVGARDYFLYGVDTTSAKLAWQNAFWFSWVESTPRVVDNTLYVGGSDFRRISAINAADGAIRWATDVRGLSWGSPVVTADSVFAGTAGQTIEGTVIQHRGGIVALNRGTGAVLWRYETPARAGADFNGFTGSLVLVDNKIIGAGVDGKLIALPAMPAAKSE